MRSICFIMVFAAFIVGHSTLDADAWQDSGIENQAEEEPGKFSAKPMAENLFQLQTEAGPSLGPKKNQNPGFQVKVNGEVRTITVTDRNRDIKITEDRTQGIVVEIVRTYGPNDLAQLKQNHPELTDYIELFPKQSGSHQIELNLSIKSVYKARTPEQLKEKSEDAFAVYRKQTRKAGRRN